MTALIYATANAAVLEEFTVISEGAPHFAGTWEVSSDLTGSGSSHPSFLQGDGVYDISGTGVTNGADSFMEIHYAPYLDLESQPALKVSAQALAGNTASSFEVRLFDAAGRSAFAQFSLADFPMGDYAEASSPLVRDSNFDGSSIETMRVSGGRLAGMDSFAVSFDEVGASTGSFHDADQDRDSTISLAELLRVIEIYNTRFGTRRTGAYRVAAASSDGFESALDIDDGDANILSRYHSADFGRDGRVSLGELLRVIELYNFRQGTQRLGAYRIDPASVDGFQPGLRE